MRLHHLRQELLVLHRAATPVIEVLDERLDEAAECLAHRVQCIPAPIGEIRYAYIVDHGDEASQSKPAQALSHLLNVVKVAIEVADRFCQHQPLREPRHAVHSLPNGEVRLVLPIEDMYCSWEPVEMHLEVPWAELFNEPVDIVQEPVGRQSGAQSRHPSVWSEHAEAQQPRCVGPCEGPSAMHLHGPFSKRTMGGIRRKSLCRKSRSRGLPASGSCPLHFGEPSTNKWTWMLWSSAIGTSRNARTTSIAEQYSRWRIPTFWSSTTVSPGVSVPVSDLANAWATSLLALTQTSITSTESWSSHPCWWLSESRALG